MQLKSKKYSIQSPLLQNFIQFFWVLDDNIPALNHKLLPIKNIDLIINYTNLGKTTISNNERVNRSQVYFTGLQNSYHFNYQQETGKTFIIGIAFQPFGYYPFLNIPLNEFKNSVIDFSLISTQHNEKLLNAYAPEKPIEVTLNRIEKILLQMIDYKIVNSFQFTSIFEKLTKSECTVDGFCENSGVNKRKLERDFNKYVGLSPKKYLKLHRFRSVITDITHGKFNNLSDLALNNGYYDQMHFIRDFKNFTGSSPTTYFSERKAIKQISVLL